MVERPKIGDTIRCVGGPQEGRLDRYDGSEAIKLPCRSATGDIVPDAFDLYRLTRQGKRWVYTATQQHA
jgi:hypothetical protein